MSNYSWKINTPKGGVSSFQNDETPKGGVSSFQHVFSHSSALDGDVGGIWMQLLNAYLALSQCYNAKCILKKFLRILETTARTTTTYFACSHSSFRLKTCYICRQGSVFHNGQLSQFGKSKIGLLKSIGIIGKVYLMLVAIPKVKTLAFKKKKSSSIVSNMAL